MLFLRASYGVSCILLKQWSMTVGAALARLDLISNQIDHIDCLMLRTKLLPTQFGFCSSYAQYNFCLDRQNRAPGAKSFISWHTTFILKSHLDRMSYTSASCYSEHKLNWVIACCLKQKENSSRRIFTGEGFIARYFIQSFGCVYKIF